VINSIMQLIEQEAFIVHTTEEIDGYVNGQVA